jgi:hypothetical protein
VDPHSYEIKPGPKFYLVYNDIQVKNEGEKEKERRVEQNFTLYKEGRVGECIIIY